jgi:hypothetical protein
MHTTENPKDDCSLCKRIIPENQKPFGLIKMEEMSKQLMIEFQNPAVTDRYSVTDRFSEKFRAMEADYEK